jgi:3-methyladenine DNA glycosylase AlkD
VNRLKKYAYLSPNMHNYLRQLEKIFQKNANPIVAAGAKAYQKNQFDFFGIPTPLRRSLGNAYMKEGLPNNKELPAIIKEFWSYPKREFQYFAAELLFQYRKEWEESTIRLIEYLFTHKSWWDTVEFV